MTKGLAGSCVLCDSPFRTTIDQMIADGATVKVVQTWMAVNKLTPPARITFWKHTKHPNPIKEQRSIRSAAIAIQQYAKSDDIPEPKVPRVSNKDAALLVRDRGVQRIEAGELDVTVAETLRAQEILDRRMEKQGDRDLIIGFLEALGGEPLALPEPSIEGEIIGESFATRIKEPSYRGPAYEVIE